MIQIITENREAIIGKADIKDNLRYSISISIFVVSIKKILLIISSNDKLHSYIIQSIENISPDIIDNDSFTLNILRSLTVLLK